MLRWIRKIITFFIFSILIGYIVFVAVPMGHFCALFRNSSRFRLKFHRSIRRGFRFFVLYCLPKSEFRVHNEFHETFHKPALIIANHQSLLDLPATLMLRDKLVAMCGQWVWESRLYGPVIRYASFFPASMSLEDMVAHVRSCMQQGYSVIIFPEGTRSEDCQVHKFRRGAFHIAEQLQCDIVPIVLHGTGKVLPKKDFCYYPGPVRIEIGERVSFESGKMGKNHGAMTRYWHQWFVKRYAEIEAEMSD